MDKYVELRRKHHEKYMINFENINIVNIENIFPLNSVFVCDTESSFINEDEKEVHVYAWGLMCNLTDYCVYGTNLDDLFKLFNIISKTRIPKKLPKSTKGYNKIKSDCKYRCFIHNLGWDFEFMKYVLNNRQNSYKLPTITKSNKKCKEKPEPNTYHVVENNNITYASTVTLETLETIKTYKKIEGEKYEVNNNIFTEIEFIDSYKILPYKLDDIAKKVITIPDEFMKMGDKYDYDKIRKPGHELTELELHYLYNDVYILKEFYNQYYLSLETKALTVSGIAFEKYLNIVYGEKNPYKKFVEDFPDLSEYTKIFNIIKKSYMGGWTQANKKYLGKKVKCYGVSIDINSSYPYVVGYKPLPYGKPEYYEGYKKKGKNQNSILTICFDGFRNKNKDDLIGKIQVGAISAKEFGLIGTEYIPTNMFNYSEDGNKINNCDLKGLNGESNDYRYKMSIWDFELENLLETMEFFICDKKYCEIREEYIDTKNLTKGYDIESTLIFNMKTGHFLKAVEHFNTMKIEGKKEGNKVKTNIGKTMNNSFYGKLASNFERVEREVCFNDSGIACYKTTDIQYDAERKYYPAFSSAVTAWARVNLRTTLYKVGYNNVLYFDTDSLYTTLTPDEVKQKCGDILHPTELGKWDIEKEYNEFKTIGAKKYILNGRDYVNPDKIKYINNIEHISKNGKYVERETNHLICKCAGLPKEVRDTVTFETFYLGKNFKGKKVKTKFKGGYALVKGDYQIKSNPYRR